MIMMYCIFFKDGYVLDFLNFFKSLSSATLSSTKREIDFLYKFVEK